MLEYNWKSTYYEYTLIVEPLGSPIDTNRSQGKLKEGLKHKINNIEAIHVFYKKNFYKKMSLKIAEMLRKC